MNRDQAIENMDLMRDFPINCPVVWNYGKVYELGFVVGYRFCEDTSWIQIRQQSGDIPIQINPYSTSHNLRKAV